mmetsp:Transcript_31954/g.62523  ORF Transcript_31954/g.62523 Transcript_31954/m.62523 type:complete len:80 (+) Transcript_31954:475-714(+)
MPQRWPRNDAFGTMMEINTNSNQHAYLRGTGMPYTSVIRGELKLSTTLYANSTPEKPIAQVFMLADEIPSAYIIQAAAT